jgi:filamentous hemagglutinin
VYNLEVDTDHVYRVTELGLLVHNASKGNGGNPGHVPTTGTARSRSGRRIAQADKAGDFGAPKKGTLSNVDARKWYLNQEARILDEIDPNLPIRDRAVQAFNRRNELRTEARDLMADRAEATRLMREEPNRTLWEIVRHKYKNKGLTGDALWQDILDSARKSRSNINKILGLE